MFESIVLRSWEDSVFFVSLLKAAPLEGLAHPVAHTKRLWIEYDITDDNQLPWLHHIGVYHRLLPTLKRINLYIRGRHAMKDEHIHPRAVSQLLRNPLPAPFLLFTDIVISNISFPSFAALRRVLRPMRQLREIVWHDVTWDTDVTAVSPDDWQLNAPLPIYTRCGESQSTTTYIFPRLRSYIRPSRALRRVIKEISTGVSSWSDCLKNDKWKSGWMTFVQWDLDDNNLST